MNKKFRYLQFLIGFCGSMLFIQPIYAQRAGTTVERNEDAREINDLYKVGKWEEGKKIAETSLKKNPKDSDMRMLVGKYFIHRGQFEKARYELVKSLEYAPANVESKHMLVTVETETERYSSAICYINELLEVNPYWKGLWRKKIELYRKMGNHVEADRLLKRISQIYPEDSELKGDLAYQLEQRSNTVRKSGNVDESLSLSKKMVEEQPGRTEGYYSVIDTYIKAGDYQNALGYTDRALNRFPGNAGFVQKKIAILEEQRRYPELLAFMEQQMKGGSGSLRTQYNYFLLEAARDGKNNDPSNLYGKIFLGSAGNREAFDYVFNDQVSKGQYEEAISSLNRHRSSVGNGKDLDMKELGIYRRMNDQSKIATFTKEYFKRYPNDSDLRDAYISVTLQSARANIADGKISSAVADWMDIIRFGDEESVEIARNGLYSAYVTEKRYQDAILILDEMMADSPTKHGFMLKKSDLYNKQGKYIQALSAYEEALGEARTEDRERLIGGYNEMVLPWVKELRENYQLTEARQLCDRWLTLDDRNRDALLYMINICFQQKDYGAMLRYAQIAESRYPEDMVFKMKLAEAMNHDPERLAGSWDLLHTSVRANPFHETLVNTFSHTTELYAKQLLKEKEFTNVINSIDTSLHYKDNNKTLKYMKGLAYEGLKQYDSAYYYQGFHEPSMLELDEFKNHLLFLAQKGYRNHVGISHLRSRFGDDHSITSISTFEYTRQSNNGSLYTGRINYAGREEGKGIQGQIEWTKPWSETLSSRIDLALSNKFFAKVSANAAIQYIWKPTWEAEAAAGYRRFFSGQNLTNLNVGISKEIGDFRLGAKLSNFYLDNAGERFYLYNVGARAQYFMANPKNYILALAGGGNSPDIDLLDNQLYNSFNVFNAMVGAGGGRAITRNVSASVIGTWYNFQTDRTMVTATYRNMYNLYLQVNVSF